MTSLTLLFRFHIDLSKAGTKARKQQELIVDGNRGNQAHNLAWQNAQNCAPIAACTIFFARAVSELS